MHVIVQCGIDGWVAMLDVALLVPLMLLLVMVILRAATNVISDVHRRQLALWTRCSRPYFPTELADHL